MSWLFALLSFAGVMVILSTVVTALVEFTHKMFLLRRNGLDEMLRALHDSVLAPMLGGDGAAGDDPADPKGDGAKAGASAAARQFSQRMTGSPAFVRAGRWWSPRTWWGFNTVFQPRFERLTTLQFVEQLARTAPGQALAQQDRPTVERALHRAAYQFERYGQAQSDYFRRRAKVISALAAFAVVLVGNINGLAIYRHLASSADAQTGVLSLVQGLETNGLASQIDAAQERLRTLQDTALNPAADRLSLQAGAAEAQGQLQALERTLADAKGHSASLTAIDLPIGRAYFPFCDARAPRPDGGAFTDGCNLPAEATKLHFAGFTPADPTVGRLLSPEGILWLVSLIGTAGLLALGAPFWFDVFRTLAGLVTPRTRLPALGEKPTQEGKAMPTLERLRPSDSVDPAVLAEAFFSAGGRLSNLGAAPAGGRLGPSTAERRGYGPPAIVAADDSAGAGDPLGGAASRFRRLPD